PAGPVPTGPSVAPPAPAGGDPVDDVPAPPALVVLPLVDPPAPVGAVGPGWPCSVCSSVVPYEAEKCPVCGAGFLSALTGIGIPRLPVVGAPSAGSRRLIWVAAAVVFASLGMLLLLAFGLAGRATG
ncbi:MAG: hypothetical protein M3P95_12750, partial [Actinomycetota bacterium]|nr:hypothetical protein [Actinomycetota bacterium]